MKCPSYNVFFETIAPPLRIKIIQALKKKPLSVSNLCEKIGEEQSKVSHNLKKLFECNFIDVERDGKRRVYSLNKETIVPLLELVEKHVNRYCCRTCSKRH